MVVAPVARTNCVVCEVTGIALLGFGPLSEDLFRLSMELKLQPSSAETVRELRMRAVSLVLPSGFPVFEFQRAVLHCSDTARRDLACFLVLDVLDSPTLLRASPCLVRGSPFALRGPSRTSELFSERDMAIARFSALDISS